MLFGNTGSTRTPFPESQFRGTPRVRYPTVVPVCAKEELLGESAARRAFGGAPIPIPSLLHFNLFYYMNANWSGTVFPRIALLSYYSMTRCPRVQPLQHLQLHNRPSRNSGTGW